MSAKTPKLQITRQCRCCLRDKNLKDLWSDHKLGAKPMNYGRMLVECFGLEGPQWTADSGDAKICKDCVSQLLYAHSFKERILDTDELIKDESGVKAELKLEVEIDTENELDEKASLISDSSDMDAEFLDEDEPYVYMHKEKSGRSGEASQIGMENEQVDPIMELAVEAVLSGKLAQSAAAAIFKIPSRLLGAQLKESDKPQSTVNLSPDQQLESEIKTLLTYTNGTPFKTKGGQYYCAYCPPMEARFDDPAALRAHTRIQHAAVRVRSVGAFMTPHWMNEILKLDIAQLHCILCYTSLQSWNEMFTHLSEVHSVDLELAYSRVIPFKLEEGLKCALCNEGFPSFHTLDNHMNAHYNNYICNTCGDSYLSQKRLSKHVRSHERGQFPCELCGKMFPIDRYRKKHVDIVHRKKPLYKCAFCGERYQTENIMQDHIAEQHKDKSKKYPCDLCTKVFELKSYLLKHKRVKHSTREKKYSCKRCSKKFFLPYELRNHEKWHADHEDFLCSICNTKFSTTQYLQKHQMNCHKGVMKKDDGK